MVALMRGCFERTGVAVCDFLIESDCQGPLAQAPGPRLSSHKLDKELESLELLGTLGVLQPQQPAMED